MARASHSRRPYPVLPADPSQGQHGHVGIPAPDLSCLDLESELQRLCRTDHPPAVWGRAAVAQVQVFSANLPAG